MVIVGIDAVAKAKRTAQAILVRTRAIFDQLGLPDYSATHIEVIGAESLYGPHSRAQSAREVMMRLVVNHPQKQALEIFAREIAPSGTSWAPGTTSPGGGRPPVSPLIKPFSFLLDKRKVPVSMLLDGQRQRSAGDEPLPFTSSAELTEQVPLIKLAWARSGDKGNISNIGVIARRPEWLPLLWQQVTSEAVKDYFAHLVHGRVERFRLPGIHAINFLLYDALDGGGPGSMRVDPLGKGMAQMLLDMPVRVPRSVAATL